MVRFEKNRFIIEIYTGTDPIEDWMELHQEICYLISLVNQENAPTDGLIYTPKLLEGLMPEWEVARRMTH